MNAHGFIKSLFLKGFVALCLQCVGHTAWSSHQFRNQEKLQKV